MLSHLSEKIRKKAGFVASSFLYKKNAAFCLDFPVISFTFDDFYRSALGVGGKLLEERGLKGTFYASMSLMGKSNRIGDFFTEDDLKKTAKAGHEIGGHTFGHLSCSQFSAELFSQDSINNNEAINLLLGGYEVRNFSFPFGDVFPAHKKLLNEHFRSLRCIRGGINLDKIDLGLLRCNRLYSDSVSIESVKKIIEEISNRKAWLIFYTHDISEKFSPWGCSPDLFGKALDLAIDSGAKILTIDKAIDSIIRGL